MDEDELTPEEIEGNKKEEIANFLEKLSYYTNNSSVMRQHEKEEYMNYLVDRMWIILLDK